MFAVWKACCRLGIKPPGVKDRWEEMHPMAQARAIVFDQTLEHDEAEQMTTLLNALYPR